jgi:Tfp pilus assembly protein PilF
VPKIFCHQISYRSVTIVGICVFLAAITWLVFGQTLGHEFINYDDPEYVYNNLQVASGLSLHGVTWAFTHSHCNNWHPLTWLSHMLDCQLYGRKAGGHHFTNVLLHALGVLLLFLVLRQMTGALWRSAFVATLFAIHPLHVESVAWIAERKDVLSGVFFMLTLGAYVRYVRAPSIGRYSAVAVVFALGLMSKPMLVTVPFVLLLLDYWPLGRFGYSSPARSKRKHSDTPKNFSHVGRVIVKKAPLLALSAASCVATLLAQGDAISSIAWLPLWWRLNNAFVSYIVYVRQMMWPAGLAPFYTYPQTLPHWEITLSVLLLIAITAAAVVLRRKYPYVVTGWFWYLGMLMPVIGVIQVGSQAHADRYTYLPQIGLYLALTWAVVDLSQSWHYRWILGIAAAAVVASLSWSAWTQASYWRDSESLWKHTLAVTSNNEVAANNLGNLFLEKGLIDEAAVYYQKAVNVWPNHPTFQANLGKALLRKGLADQAIPHFQKAMELPSSHDEAARGQAQSNIGNALLQKGLVDEAIAQFQQALELAPEDRIIHNDFGNALLQKGQLDKAIAQFQRALDSGVEDAYTAHIHYNLGNALRQNKLVGEAVAHYQEALKREPRLVLAQNQLAWVLATCSDASLRNGPKAVEFARQASELSGGRNPVILHTLAAAYAENGQFSEAVETAKSALELAASQGNPALLQVLPNEIALYQAGSPYHER